MGRACTQGSKETPRTRQENEVGERVVPAGSSLSCVLLLRRLLEDYYCYCSASYCIQEGRVWLVAGVVRWRGVGGWFALLSAFLSLLFYLCFFISAFLSLLFPLCRYFAFLLYSYCTPLCVVQQLGPSKLQVTIEELTAIKSNETKRNVKS